MSETYEFAIFLCSHCGNYEPLTDPGYHGHLSGYCNQCADYHREVHRFGLSVSLDRLGPCECSGVHARRETA